MLASMSEPRILLAAGLYPPDIGGPATYAHMIASTLPERGIPVSVVPFSSVRSYPKILRHAAYAWRLYKAAGAADIIYALDPVSVGLPALIVSLVRRRPLLLRLGGDYAWEQGQQRFGVAETLDAYTAARKRAPWPVRCFHALQVVVCKRAQKVIVPSAYLGRIVQTWGVPEDRIVVIHSALSPLPRSMDRAAARAHFAVGGFVIVSVSRLTPWKGEAALIDLMPQLKAAGIDATLVIGGDGRERAALEAQVQRLGIGDAVRFLGALDRQTLGNLLAAADVYVLNSAYEGLSHQLLEVMAAQVPIVASAVGGNPDLIAHSETGLLVPYNDAPALQAALVDIYHDYAAATTRASKAAALVTAFSAVSAEADLVRVISSIWEH